MCVSGYCCHAWSVLTSNSLLPASVLSSAACFQVLYFLTEFNKNAWEEKLLKCSLSCLFIGAITQGFHIHSQVYFLPHFSVWLDSECVIKSVKKNKVGEVSKRLRPVKLKAQHMVHNFCWCIQVLPVKDHLSRAWTPSSIPVYRLFRMINNHLLACSAMEMDLDECKGCDLIKMSVLKLFACTQVDFN